MTNEELQRIRQYAAKVKVADDYLTVLTDAESKDLEALIEKRIEEGERCRQATEY